MGDSNGYVFAVEVVQVAAFNVVSRFMLEELRSLAEIWVIGKNRFVGDNLTVALRPVHMVECDAFADDARRVACEPHGVKGAYEKVVGRVCISRQFCEAEYLLIRIEDLGVADAIDRCLSQGTGAFDALKILANGRFELNAPCAAF